MVDLPSRAVPKRVTNALDDAYPPTVEKGRIGQPTKLHQALVERFKGGAPSYATVTRWLADDAKGTADLTVNEIYMLAVALGRDPAWLAFGYEPTTLALEPGEEIVRPETLPDVPDLGREAADPSHQPHDEPPGETRQHRRSLSTSGDTPQPGSRRRAGGQ